jgi:putative tryptophan/tyrosine transport system substrate-binding protein
VKRRDFITLLGGAATWPLTARAQQPERIRRIGVLTGGSTADNPDSRANTAAFRQGLQQLGWTEGRNVRIEYRWGAGNADDVRKYAADLAALAPDVILNSGAASLASLLQVTRTVPIVFVNVADPVGAGFVDSLSRPGGNATGFMQFEYDLSGNGWSCSSRSRRA